MDGSGDASKDHPSIPASLQTCFWVSFNVRYSIPLSAIMYLARCDLDIWRLGSLLDTE